MDLRFATFLLILCVSAEALGQSSKQPILGWRNGDKLAGEILPAAAGSISWKSRAFTAPFLLDQEQLKEIWFPADYLDAKKPDPKGLFRIRFHNGDRIYGKLISIRGKAITLDSPSFASPITVERKYVNRIESVSGNHLKYNGPMELDQWRKLGRGVKNTDWFTQKTGEFSTHRWGRRVIS